MDVHIFTSRDVNTDRDTEKGTHAQVDDTCCKCPYQVQHSSFYLWDKINVFVVSRWLEFVRFR